MELTARPATLWDTARLEGQNVLINLAAHQLPEKLVIIPADVWTRLWGTTLMRSIVLMPTGLQSKWR